MDIFVQNAAFGGSSSLSCVKVDATVFYRMWRNITVGAILMFLTGFQAQPSVAQSLCVGNVPDLKVTVTDLSGSESKTLSCITTCTLSNNPTYIWYKNGEPVPREPQRSPYYSVNKADAGSYSCAVRGHEDLRSPAVCVFDEKSCWSVTYSTQNICALIGSSVEMHSYYIYPNNYKVTKVLWFSKEQADGEAVDVREDEEYQGRVQDTQSSQNNWSLRITNLTERDAQTYRFRFYTNGGDYTGQPGVNLSVTDVKITVSDSGRGQKTLNCLTTCTLSHNPTYIWYKNGRRVSECKSASCSAAAVSGAVSYSCAVEGHDSLPSPPVYSPKSTRAVVLPSGDTVEGDSVTLSCSSDANPPVLTYSWFKLNEPADTPLTTGQNYSISDINSQDSGLYYCTAHNQLGHDNSTPTHLDVLYSPKNTRAVFFPSGCTVEGDSVTLSCSSDANPPVLTYSWFKQNEPADTPLTTGQNYSISDINSQDSGLYYCTALNQLGHDNSTPTHLNVLPALSVVLAAQPITAAEKVWTLHAVWGAAALVLLGLLTVVLCIMRKRRAERDADVQRVPSPGDDTYTGLNSRTMSPDYDTLQNVKSSASETYTALNPAAMSSDYDTLTSLAT